MGLTTMTSYRARRAAHAERDLASPHYKWIVLSNTTLGVLMATINSSILLIALPDIFRGIGINPLEPSKTSLLLWVIMGYLVVTAVLVVSFGRLGDMYGRVKMYNWGFAIFTVFSVLLSVTDGQTVTVTIEGIGELRNTVCAQAGAPVGAAAVTAPEAGA